MPFRNWANWIKTKWWAGLLALHGLKMFFWFREIDFSSPLPIVNFDYIQYYARVLRAHEFLSRSGRYWGYNPFESAGVITCFDTGTVLFSYLCHWLSPWIPIGRSLLAIELIGFAAMPFLVLLAARLLGGTRHQSWVAFGFSVVVFGIVDPVSSDAIRLGLFGYSLGAFCGILFVAALVTWTERGHAVAWLTATISGAITLLLHQALALVLAPAFAGVLILTVARRSFRTVAGLVGMAAVMLATNMIWIFPFVHFHDWLVPVPNYITTGYRIVSLFFSPFQNRLTESMRVASLLGVIWAGGLVLARRRKRQPIFFWGLSVTLLWLGMVFTWGSSIPLLNSTQPARTAIPFWILVGLVAALGWDDWKPTSLAGKKTGTIFAICVLFVFSSGFFPGAPKKKSFFNRFSPGDDAFLHELKSAKPGAGRLLMETTNLSSRSNLADIVPFVAGVPTVGGPDAGVFIKSRFSLFSGTYRDSQGRQSQEPRAFGKLLSELSHADLKTYLDLYNITRVAVLSPRIMERFDQEKALFVRETDAGSFALFRVKRPSSWFAQGSGEIEFDFGRIRIKNPSAGDLVLKFHWTKSLKSLSAAVAPQLLLDDPIPFILIRSHPEAGDILVEDLGV